LFIIWGALWFWPEKTRTVHHLGSSIILTWEDQNDRAPQMMDSTGLLKSKS
jgi:hypothetical protein